MLVCVTVLSKDIQDAVCVTVLSKDRMQVCVGRAGRVKWGGLGVSSFSAKANWPLKTMKERSVDSYEHYDLSDYM